MKAEVRYSACFVHYLLCVNSDGRYMCHIMIFVTSSKGKGKLHEWKIVWCTCMFLCAVIYLHVLSYIYASEYSGFCSSLSRGSIPFTVFEVWIDCRLLRERSTEIYQQIIYIFIYKMLALETEKELTKSGKCKCL